MIHDSVDLAKMTNDLYCDVLHLRNQLQHLLNEDLSATIGKAEDRARALHHLAIGKTGEVLVQLPFPLVVERADQVEGSWVERKRYQSALDDSKHYR